jgi:hypothetical protein
MTRYTLFDQAHFLANVPGRDGDVVVTLQHWKSPKGAAILVVTHDGEEKNRLFVHDPAVLAKIPADFAAQRAAHADTILSEEKALDEVAKRGGPTARHCAKKDCPSTLPIPFAASMCAAGCLPADDRSRIEALSVSQRRQVMVPLTGGRR